MTQKLTAEGAALLAIPTLNNEIEEQFRVLLETKYLYQRVTINWNKVNASLFERVMPAYQRQYSAFVDTIPKMPFALAPKPTMGQSQGMLGQLALTLTLTNITMFCKKCDRREAFRPIWYRDLAAELRSIQVVLVRAMPLPANFQLFSLVYQCQACEGQPEALIIRRDGWTLTLDGRSPMASVEVASYIPKREGQFFRDAIIANGAGKTLAGIFFLRTFIEQFGRRLTGIYDKERGDQIWTRYNTTLPSHLRDSMPSLGEWYQKLSVAIHSADADEELFNNAKEKIEEHFEIRKAMRIPEVTVSNESQNGADEASQATVPEEAEKTQDI